MQLLNQSSNISAIFRVNHYYHITMRRKVKSDKYYPEKANLSYFNHYGYQITKEIGCGGYGIVYKAISLTEPHQQFAIKINFQTVSRQTIFTQLGLLELAKDKPHLPKLCNVFMHQQNVYIVTEYFKSRPQSVLFETLPIGQVKHYLWQLLNGLKELKELGIHHRDLKPNNYLYNPETRKGMVIDLGMAEVNIGFVNALKQKIKSMNKSDPQYTQNCRRLDTYEKITRKYQFQPLNKVGTKTYAPLQSILHHPDQDYSSDIWTVGVMFLSFITRKNMIFTAVEKVKIKGVQSHQDPYVVNFLIQLATIFSQERVINQCKQFGFDLKLPKGIQYTPIIQLAKLEGYNDEAHDLLMKLMDLNPESRITPQNALKHPFFDSVRYKDSEAI